MKFVNVASYPGLPHILSVIVSMVAIKKEKNRRLGCEAIFWYINSFPELPQSVEHRARPPILAGSHLAQHELPGSESPALLQHCQGTLPQRGQPALSGTQVRAQHGFLGLRNGAWSPGIGDWGTESWDWGLGHGALGVRADFPSA